MRQKPPHSLPHPHPCSLHPLPLQPEGLQLSVKLAPAGPRVLWASATLGIKSPILSSPHKGFLVYPRLPLQPVTTIPPNSAHLLYRLPFNAFWASGSLSSWLEQRLFPLLRTLFPIPLSLDNPPHCQYHIIIMMLTTIIATAAKFENLLCAGHSAKCFTGTSCWVMKQG